MVWYFHLFKKHPQFVVIHTDKGFIVANEVEVGVFLEPPSFLHDSVSAGNSISGSSASLKPNLYTWKVWVHVLLKSGLKNFEHNLASM